MILLPGRDVAEGEQAISDLDRIRRRVYAGVDS